MLEARDRKPIRFERVNADTGDEVPWKDIVKAFEYDKESYVVIDKEDIASAAPETRESVEIEAFVDEDAIDVLDGGDEPKEDTATNVVDFVALPQKSLGEKGGKPNASGKAPKKAPAKKSSTSKPRKSA